MKIQWPTFVKFVIVDLFCGGHIGLRVFHAARVRGNCVIFGTSRVWRFQGVS